MVRAAGDRGSWGLLAALALLALAQPLACDKDRGGDTGVSAALDAALAQVGPGVVLPALAQATADAESLNAALELWQANPQDAALREAAQSAWVTAMRSVQVLEVLQVGPGGSSLTAVGGEDRRDAIYSWPTINPCQVDQVTVDGGWDEPDFFTTNLVNVFGLDALEQLLFSGEDNSCPGQVDINTDGSWDALGPAGVQERRAAYAAALGAEVEAQLRALALRWDPAGGDWSRLLRAQDTDSPYESPQQALNGVYDALFYLELITKDRKLGQPLGLADCSAPPCDEDAEHQPSGKAIGAITANLEGFSALYRGGDGAGLDDLLVELGHEALDGQIRSALDAAIAQSTGFDGTLVDALSTDPEAVEALYAAVKAVTDLLKSDLATVLVLQVPAEAAGDND